LRLTKCCNLAIQKLIVMRKITLLFFILLLAKDLAAQNVGIGTITPNAAAQLDISSSTKGILIPRTSSATRITIPAVKALLLYDTTTSSFWYNDGASWLEIINANNGWKTSGNTGTTISNFIGTTDNQPLRLRINNQYAGLLDSSNLGLTFFGYGAGKNNTGSNNTATGFKSLNANTTGSFNTASGYRSLDSNTTGGFNTAFGALSLITNTSGAGNTASGVSALYANTTGNYNTAAGIDALRYNTTGNNNAAAGTQALYSNTTGSNNAAMGTLALYYNTSGSHNTSMGYNSMLYRRYGNDNTAIGHNALLSDTVGQFNVAIGSGALAFQYGKSNIVAIGDSALYVNGYFAAVNEGIGNTAVGSKTLFSNTTGSSNTATGYHALRSNTNGFYNTAAGYQALDSNTTGYYNTANGTLSLITNTTGHSNTATGVSALYANTSGTYNTANGLDALRYNTTGDYNVAIGTGALYTNTTGDNNTMVGVYSGNQSTGSSNTFIGGGSNAFSNTTGSFNVALGAATQVGANVSNAIAIGANASITQSNSMALGGTGANAVKVGIGTTAPQAELEVNGYTMLGSAAPKIQMKKLTGTTNAAQGGTISILHGLTSSKILSVDILVEYTSGGFIHPSYNLSNGYEFNYFIIGANITIANISGNSGNILSKPIRILITYEQ
jgi:trimeric autotransporter adhesin